VVAPDGLNAMPAPRDADGRTGPLSEYAEIACKTGGLYLYATDAAQIQQRFDTVLLALDGTWKVDVGLDSMVNLDSNGAYMLSGALDVSLDDRVKTSTLSLVDDGEGGDLRAVVFKRE
jgi:hypothetical protein